MRHLLPHGLDTRGTYTFAFDAPIGQEGALLLLVLAPGLTALYWWLRLRSVEPRRRGLLVGLRAATLLLVLFLLLDPVLSAQRLEPGRHFALVLFDDSRSMQVPGADGRTRGERLLAAWERSGLGEALARTHQVVLFRFGEHLERLRAPSELRFAQRLSDLEGAVDAALQRMGGAAVSAVILFSDGVQLGREGGLHPPAAPVFAVGTDADTLWRALQLSGLSVARTHQDNGPVALVARIRAEGLEGRQAVLEVLEGDRPLAATPLALGAPAAEIGARLEFLPRGEGWRAYRARVRLAGADTPGSALDPLAEDNLRDFLVDNRPRTYRILHLSGRPTWEHKFLRRALQDDPRLQLSSLVRVSGAERAFVFKGRSASLANPLFEGFAESSPNTPRYDEAVFLRLGLGPAELTSGYPADAGSLFPYHLVVWSAMERDFFSREQLELTRDFVARRGGRFLFSGDPRSPGGDGYAGTPIEAALPAVLARRGANQSADRPFRPRPTIEGFLSGMWALAADPDSNAALWARLPLLHGAHRLSATRAGATVLAQVDAPASDLDGQAFFAWQRYGEGATAVLATDATWPWQMLAAEGEAAHGRFWRQLLRGLLQDVPEPLYLAAGGADLHAGDEADLHFVVRDSLFTRREGLAVRLELSPPTGGARTLPVEESLRETGLYSAEFHPSEPGLYLLRLSARDGEDRPVGSLEQAVLVHPDNRELQSARYNPTFLQALADRSGGRFFTLDELSRIPEYLPRAEGLSQHLERFPLWHWPPFYLLLAALLCGEWYLRRKQGQP